MNLEAALSAVQCITIDCECGMGEFVRLSIGLLHRPACHSLSRIVVNIAIYIYHYDSVIIMISS